MDDQDHTGYYKILEIKPDSPFSEIKSAYLHLKRLYSSDSAVLSPLIEEISAEKREKLLVQIEEAYNNLREYHSTRQTEKQKITRERVLHDNIPEFEIFSGNALRLTREVLGVELQEIALAIGISMKHLRNIEMERFDQLPPPGYVRIYVSKYAKYLSLDAKRVTEDYMKAFNKKRKNSDRDRY
jgi:curved DNA-binding protein CbpA